MGPKRRTSQRAVLRVVIADDHRLLLEAVQGVLAPDPDIEVGGGEVHCSFLGLQQNVRKNWQRSPGADDILHLLQSFE